MRKVFDVDGKIMDGEILIYKDGKIKGYKIHELLPDLEEAKNDISHQDEKIAKLEQTVADLAKLVKEK